MVDKINVSSQNSYGNRLGNSFKKIFGGIILILIAIALLARNENNFVEEEKALNEGSKAVQEAISSTLDPTLEGKLIHITWETQSPEETLRDEVFGFVTEDLKLQRTVEMYQWKETADEKCEDNYGGSETCTTTYDYQKVWSDQAIDSSHFYQELKHENPTHWEYTSQHWEKSPILLGAFSLADAFTSQLQHYEEMSLKEQQLSLPEFNEEHESTPKMHRLDKMLYLGIDPKQPRIGDLRISFSTVKNSTISAIGKQSSSELTNYTTANGRSIALLEDGVLSAEEMFIHALEANTMITRFLRIVGLVLMYTGFSMMLQFISTLAKVVPPLASLIGMGTALLAFGATLLVGIGTIAIAWIAVRPLVGIPLLLIALGGAYMIWKKKAAPKAE